MSEKLEDIRRALYAITDKESNIAIKELASAYEEITLSSEIFPDECVDLIIEILSTKNLYTKHGINIFISTTYTDMYRLSDKQKQLLIEAISNHYCEYSDLEMCWQLGDLVARSYDQISAMRVFRKVFNSATRQGKEGVILGMDVLAKHSKHDPNLMTEIGVVINGSSR